MSAGMVDATARIEAGAKIGVNVSIGPYCTIGPHVTVADADMAGKQSVVGKHDVVSDLAIMSDMRTDHKKTVVADLRDPAAVLGAGAHRHVFADVAIGADHEPGRTAAITE